jgi:hypothetical protein
MAGTTRPAIHGFARGAKDVDGRHEGGHDDKGNAREESIFPAAGISSLRLRGSSRAVPHSKDADLVADHAIANDIGKCGHQLPHGRSRYRTAPVREILQTVSRGDQPIQKHDGRSWIEFHQVF